MDTPQLASSLAYLLGAEVALWLLAELAMLVALRPTAAGDQRRDGGTLGLVVVVIALVLPSSALVAWQQLGAWPPPVQVPLRAVGSVLVVLGVGVRWAAVLTLRRYFTVAVAIRPDHQLVDWGLYRFVRHPSYSGAIVALIGVGLGSGSWLAALLLTVPLTLAVLRRIVVEERALLEGLGEPYARWRSRTPALVPRLRDGRAKTYTTDRLSD